MLRPINRDKLIFTLLLATALHAVILLGIAPGEEKPVFSATPLSIVLRQAGDARTQSGALVLPQNDDAHPSNSRSDQAQMTAEAMQQPPEKLLSAEEIPTRTDAMPSILPPVDRQTMTQQILLFEQRAEQKEGNARKRNLASVGMPTAAESAYLAMWRRKCERIGGNNYPAGGLQGELTMRVIIDHSGRLLDVFILRSSGHMTLDNAALRTVRQASPYQPFNVEMRKRYDQLSFTRTWEFSRRGPSIN